VAATIQQLRRALPDAEIICFSLSPHDTATRHGVESYSIRFRPRCERRAVPGGQQAGSNLVPIVSVSDGKASAEELFGLGEGIKARMKAMPIIGPLGRFVARTISSALRLGREIEFTIDSARYLRRFNLLVIAGSNQLLDNFGGPWGFPYTLLKWTVLAKVVGTRVAFVSVGAGPLEGALSFRFVRLALRLADYASYRDSLSKVLVERTRFGVDGRVYPDLAFGLEYAKRTDRGPGVGKPVVGINPMPVFDSRYWFEHDENRYRDYVSKLAELATRLRRNGYRVFFFPTMWRDNQVICDVLRALRSQAGAGVGPEPDFESVEQVGELLDVLQEADIVVSTRFHGVVLPYHVGVPLVGIGYYRKTRDLMTDLGQCQYHEDLYDLCVDRLWQKLLALEANLEAEKTKIAQRTAEYRRLVAEQWDKVVELVHG
jgi:polysaccharide pyruvyl transferase WcaK-like protein